MNRVLILIAISVLAIGCKKDHPDPKPIVYTPEYSIGEVLYLKPDSLKAVVQDFDEYDNTYDMYWREGDDYPHVWVSKSMIYGTVIPNETYE
jgi:hypothetical protein